MYETHPGVAEHNPNNLYTNPQATPERAIMKYLTRVPHNYMNAGVTDITTRVGATA